MLAGTMPGEYVITVNHKGTLAEDEQTFSLVVSGQTHDSLELTPATPLRASGPIGGPFTPSCASYGLKNTGAFNIQWTAESDAAWFAPDLAGGSLDADQTAQVGVCLTAEAASLPAGTYGGTLTFTNLATNAVTNDGFNVLRIWDRHALQTSDSAIDDRRGQRVV